MHATIKLRKQRVFLLQNELIIMTEVNQRHIELYVPYLEQALYKIVGLKYMLVLNPPQTFTSSLHEAAHHNNTLLVITIHVDTLAKMATCSSHNFL